MYFTKWKIIKEIITASLISFGLTMISLSLFDFGAYNEGKFFGWFSFGNMVALGVTLVLQMKLFSMSNTFSFFLLLSGCLAVGLFLIFWMVESFISSSNLFATMTEILLSWQLYLYLLVAFCIGIIEYLWIKMEFYAENSNLNLNEEDVKVSSQFDVVKSTSNSEKSMSQNLNMDLQGGSIMDDYKDSEDDSDSP